MSNGQFMSRIIRTIGLILTLGASMNACSSTMTWKEEVVLHDGNKIVITRFNKRGDYPTIDSRERTTLEETVTFKLPGQSQEITWNMDFRDSVPEPNSLNLLVLDIVNGTPYIAAYPAGCIAYNKWKRPNPPYIFFKYERNTWKRISLEEFPAELSQTNTIVGSPPAELLKPYYTVEGVKERNQGLEKHYRAILRTETKSAGEGCPKLVRVEGGWVSPSGAKAPIPIIPSNTGDVKK